MKLSILSLVLSIQTANAFVSAPSSKGGASSSSALQEQRIWQGEAGHMNSQQGYDMQGRNNQHGYQGYSSTGTMMNDVQSYSNAGSLAMPNQVNRRNNNNNMQGGANMMPQGPMPHSRQDRNTHPGNPTVQGRSQATFANPMGIGGAETNVELGSDGRPVHATVEHWSGPNNVPARMELYSEDGYAHPWITQFRTAPQDAWGGITQVRNVGPMEFPMSASVTSAPPGQGIGDMTTSTTMTPAKTVDGGALKTFMFDHSTNSVYIEIFSQGLPINARVELWQGPSATKQLGRIYADNGSMRPWSAVIPLNTGYSGSGGSICVVNEGPMEYPISVRCDPPPINCM